VIDFVNENFVPVWVNIRCEPFPDAPALTSYYTWDLLLDRERRVTSAYYLGYFLRTYVLDADGRTLYDDEDGVLGRISMRPGPYMDMLRASLERFRLRS
jgi:hypothetical protein